MWPTRSLPSLPVSLSLALWECLQRSPPEIHNIQKMQVKPFQHISRNSSLEQLTFSYSMSRTTGWLLKTSSPKARVSSFRYFEFGQLYFYRFTRRQIKWLVTQIYIFFYRFTQRRSANYRFHHFSTFSSSSCFVSLQCPALVKTDDFGRKNTPLGRILPCVTNGVGFLWNHECRPHAEEYSRAESIVQKNN